MRIEASELSLRIEASEWEFGSGPEASELN